MNAAEYRKLKADREPIADLTLPSGAVFKVRRPPLQVWVTAGRLPQSFLRASLGVAAGGQTAAADADESLGAIEFMQAAILYAVVEPKLAAGAVGDDALDPAELDEEDLHFLMEWINKGCPGVPVLTKEGQTSVEALNRFRQKRTGGRPFSLGSDSEQVEPETEPVAQTG